MIRLLTLSILVSGIFLSDGSWAQVNHADSDTGALNTIPRIAS